MIRVKSSILKTVSIIICLLLCVCVFAPAVSAKQGSAEVYFDVTLDMYDGEPDKYFITEMTLTASSALTLDGIAFKIFWPEGITLASIEGGDGIALSSSDYNLKTGIVGWQTSDAENISGVVTVAKVFFHVPVDTPAGEYTVGVSDIEVTRDYGAVVVSKASAGTMFYIEVEDEVPEDTTAAPEDTTADPEDTAAESEDTTATPEDTTAEPEDTTAEPEDTTAEPEDTTAEPTYEPLPFGDVKENNWFYEGVRYVYDNGLMSGMTDTSFEPDITTSRAMVVTILWRIEGKPTVDNAPRFKDVGEDSWYADAVAWAAKNGIVMGKSETLFDPSSDITREQMAAILYRYAKHKGIDVSARDADVGNFADADKLSTYARDAMKWANANELIRGMGNNMLAPKGGATRAQTASIFMRFVEGQK